ncbi:sulfotransferase family protein [Streptomyces griseiscabiei]|uniref:Sulfotransferase n=1 Tax=Streptomyces griseiscabiei TaxID=2993540 RepID=A0ABU4L351_9ACTN|nr:sulfotransferase [Streptomyces griseiscabiei]MBZ3905933.1 sulfotransferase [Streptomyces griseiscabiei]MDX2909563.1 sulfotransferase [Streptomyces griseiscabiei]
MTSPTFVYGTGRSGSTALSRILNAHPDVLSLNEYMASVGDAAFPAGEVDGEQFWQALYRPAPHFERMIRSGVPLPEFLYTRRPGRYASGTTGIPALSLMVLPHLTDDPDGLLDELGAAVVHWPRRTAAEHHRALFGLLCARFGRTAVVERSGYSTGWAPRLRAAFPDARFVHLFRDGPDCALSMSRHPGYRAISLLREIKARCGVDSFADLTPEHVRALPPDLAPLLGERFDPALVRDRHIPLRVFGALWSELVTEATEFLVRLPADRRATLSYERLLDHPAEELTRLAEFIGVDPLPHWLHTGSALLDHGRRGSALSLPAAELAGLRDDCAPGARVLRA